MTISERHQLDLKEVKTAYSELLRAYLQVIHKVDNYPFFVLDDETQEVTQSRHSILPMLAGFICTVFNHIGSLTLLRPLVKLYVELHVRAKLSELEIVLAQLAWLTPDRKRMQKRWLSKAKVECTELIPTLQTWQSVRTFLYLVFPIATGFALSYSQSQTIYDAAISSIGWFKTIDEGYRSEFP